MRCLQRGQAFGVLTRGVHWYRHFGQTIRLLINGYYYYYDEAVKG